MVGIPGRIVIQNGKKISNNYDQVHLPDPIADSIRSMQKQIDELKNQIEELKKEGSKV